MDTNLIIISYLSSLMANLIVLLGFISIFVWFKEQTDSRWLKQHRGGFLAVLGVAFLLFIHTEAWSNAHLSQYLIGFHWTYLNMEILALYNLTLENSSRWQLASTVGLTGLWFFMNMKIWSWPAVAVFAVLVIVEGCIYIGSRWLTKNMATYQLGFWVAAVLVFVIATLIYAHQDIYSWLRQISALLVLNLFCYLYGKALINRVILNNLFEHRAMYDELIKLRNFGAFDHDLEHLYQQFRTTGERYALYEMDIDHFKRINDTYGHPAGNVVLKKVAEQLNQVVSNLEFRARIYRTGGEEFTVILRDIQDDSERAEAISRELQQAVAQLRLEFDAQLRITLSLGEERVSETDANYLEAYKRADQYLYTSKYNGRNAITLRGRTLERLAATE